MKYTKKKFISSVAIIVMVVITIVAVVVLPIEREEPAVVAFSYIRDIDNNNTKSEYTDLYDFYENHMLGLNTTSDISSCRYVLAYELPSTGKFITDIKDLDLQLRFDKLNNFKNSEVYSSEIEDRSEFKLNMVNTYGFDNIAIYLPINLKDLELTFTDTDWDTKRISIDQIIDRVNETAFFVLNGNFIEFFCISSEKGLLDSDQISRIYINRNEIQQNPVYEEIFINKESENNNQYEIEALGYYKDEPNKKLIVVRFFLTLEKESNLIFDEWQVKESREQKFSYDYKVGDKQEIYRLLPSD